jgi:hypothetical protein
MHVHFVIKFYVFLNLFIFSYILVNNYVLLIFKFLDIFRIYLLNHLSKCFFRV